MSKRKVLASTLLALLAFQQLAHSEPEHRGERWAEHGGPRGEAWHGDIRYFHTHDIERWRGGRWINGWHDGRQAYWWVVGGVWYAYSVPVYPYPDPIVPSVMIEQPVAGSVPPAPPTQAPAQPQAPQFWYYCQNPTGYYPYVPECQGGWQKVPATPPAP